MTVLEAFRNRGLLVPEGLKPCYRITYNEYGTTRTVHFITQDWKTAKHELTAKWQQYAKANGIDPESITAIHCVKRPGESKPERRF